MGECIDSVMSISLRELVFILRVLGHRSIRVDWYREVADPSGGVGTADGFASVGSESVG